MGPSVIGASVIESSVRGAVVTSSSPSSSSGQDTDAAGSMLSITSVGLGTVIVFRIVVVMVISVQSSAPSAHEVSSLSGGDVGLARPDAVVPVAAHSR